MALSWPFDRDETILKKQKKTNDLIKSYDVLFFRELCYLSRKHSFMEICSFIQYWLHIIFLTARIDNIYPNNVIVCTMIMLTLNLIRGVYHKPLRHDNQGWLFYDTIRLEKYFSMVQMIYKRIGNILELSTILYACAAYIKINMFAGIMTWFLIS